MQAPRSSVRVRCVGFLSRGDISDRLGELVHVGGASLPLGSFWHAPNMHAARGDATPASEGISKLTHYPHARELDNVHHNDYLIPIFGDCGLQPLLPLERAVLL
jgi:hypothetical protein